jgi:PAS domain S-box-containing protein
MPQWFQWEFRKRDGSAIHTLVQLGVNTAAGERQLVANVHDLSRLLNAGWAFQRSGERLQQVLDSTKAVIFAKDLEGRYIFANHELERAVRRPASEIIGRSDKDLWPLELAERFRRDDLEVLEQREAIEFEWTDAFGGRLRTFLSFKFPLFDGEGNPYAVCGISTDITDRKRFEDALRSAALAVSSAHGATVFQELARYLATTLRVDGALISAPQQERPRNMRVRAFYLDGETRENFDYPIAGTPCEKVFARGVQIYPRRLKETFPANAEFAKLGFESYAGFPLTGAGGQPLGLIATVSRRPIDDPEFVESVLKIFAVRASAELERMQAEESLRTSEASYRAIFEACEDAIFIHDWDTGALVDVNPKACESYGYTAEELKRLTVADVSSGEHPYTREEAAKLLERAKAGEPLSFEWHRRNKDGSLHWDEVFLRKAVIAGKPRILAVTREITERKLTEQALRASEEHYRAIFHAAADGLLLRDAEFRVVDVNPAFLALTGYAREEVLDTAKVLTMPVDRTEYARSLQARAIKGESIRIEGEGVRKDGTRYDCEVHLVPMQYRGEPHVLGIVRDISTRKQGEAKRQQLEAQLRQAQKMEAIGHLTGGIAHDFNNLLTSIMGYVVLAAERQASLDDPKLAKYLEQAHLSCGRARDLIQQMLTFSRGQRGEPRPHSLPPLVRESVKLLRSSLPATIEIDAELDAEVPAVLIDPVQLDQILLNLCINARDVMGGIGQIQVAVRQANASDLVCASCRHVLGGAYVELCVTDSGPGVAPQVLDRMFEPFFSTKEMGKGSGMGLAIVHGIVHEHGGHIVVETDPGRGACFRILLRALDAPGRDISAPVPDGGVERHARIQLRGHVMVVDDEETVAEFMRDLLETWGLQVTRVSAPREAREMFMREPHRFDLVITDQTMPRMTGLELARDLIAKRPDLPVILYTGFGDHIPQNEIEALGIRALVKKPIEPKLLLGLLKAHIAPAAARQV